MKSSFGLLPRMQPSVTLPQGQSVQGKISMSFILNLLVSIEQNLGVAKEEACNGFSALSSSLKLFFFLLFVSI